MIRSSPETPHHAVMPMTLLLQPHPFAPCCPLCLLPPRWWTVSLVCCWVQHGDDSYQDLLEWISTRFGEFCEMKIVKHARSVGTMIGPEGHLHRWTAPREKSLTVPGKINETCKCQVERPVDQNFLLNQCLVMLDPYLHLMRQPSRKRPTRYNAPLLVLTMLYLLTFYGLDLCAVSEVTCVGDSYHQSCWPFQNCRVVRYGRQWPCEHSSSS